MIFALCLNWVRSLNFDKANNVYSEWVIIVRFFAFNNLKRGVFMKAFTAFIVTIFVGIFGIYLGAILNLEGYLGIVFAIATIGSYIVSSIEKTK
jgi:cell division protein FtsX